MREMLRRRFHEVLHGNARAQQIDLLPTAGVWLVEHCTGIPEGMGSNPVGATWSQVYLKGKTLNNNDHNQVFWARETEHPQQTIVLTKTAGQQPGSGHCSLRSSI